MSGFRGYIGSRPVRGTAYPQRVQNLVVRDYAQRRTLPFLLSLVEYAMPNCYMMLEGALTELPQLDGLILFSAFMLPESAVARRAIYRRVLEAGATLHAALENRVVATAADADALEELLLVAQTLRSVPFAGRYEKDGRQPTVTTPTEAALLAQALPG